MQGKERHGKRIKEGKYMGRKGKARLGKLRQGKKRKLKQG
jgi:hypothetical protein